jgi:hypothetical protein
MKHVHRKDSQRSKGISDGTSRTNPKLSHVSKALEELYELIEIWAPPFYKKLHHDRAAKALRLVGMHPR